MWIEVARSCVSPREHVFNTKKSRVVINVNDISFVIFVVDSGAPRDPG
jgi:hypothetical protein